MDSFEANKIFGAVLGTVFVVFGGSLLAEGLFHSEAPETAGYSIVAAEAPAAGEGAGAAAAEDPPVATLLAAADPEKGAAEFKKCQACHSGEEGGPNKVGPHLWDVVDRPVASVGDFAYSAGMKEFSQGSSLKWDYDHLYHFIKGPKQYVSGTAMGFAGLKDPQGRADLIAYLRTLSGSPAPLPEAPAPGAAPAEAAAPEAGAEAPAATADAAAPAAADAAPAAAAPAPAAPEPAAPAAAPAEAPAPAAPPAAAPAPAPAAPAPAPAVPAPAAPAEAPDAAPAPAAPAPAAPAQGAAAPAPAATQTAAAGDPKAGATAFRKCQACHAVGPGAANKIGPALNGIVGEVPGVVEGYTFSTAMQAFGKTHPAWDEALLTQWLTNPKALVPGTKMAFAGIKKPEEIANIIAYLKTFDEAGATK